MARRSGSDGVGRFNLTRFGEMITVNMDVRYAVRVGNQLRRDCADNGLWALTQRLVERSNGRIREGADGVLYVVDDDAGSGV